MTLDRIVVGESVAIDASAPSIAALTAALARLSSCHSKTRACVFSDFIRVDMGVSVGVMSVMHCVRLSSLILDRPRAAIGS